MALFENNLSPYLTLVEGASPSNPAATDHRLYVDTADKLLKWRDSSGTVRLATGQPLGLTGAVTATRYVGGTASVAPTTGTFAVGDFVITAAGGIYICTVAGSPGTWVAVSGAGGAVATDTIWAAAGDLAVATGVHTAAVLTKGAAGTVPTAGASTLAYAFPPGYEYNYVEITSPVSVTSTTAGTGQTVLTCGSVTLDGTPIYVEFYSPGVGGGSAWGRVGLYDDTGAAALGILAQQGSSEYVAHARRKLTPAAGARVYSIRAWVNAGTGVVDAGAGGGASNMMPAFVRITKA